VLDKKKYESDLLIFYLDDNLFFCHYLCLDKFKKKLCSSLFGFIFYLSSAQLVMVWCCFCRPYQKRSIKNLKKLLLVHCLSITNSFCLFFISEQETYIHLYLYKYDKFSFSHLYFRHYIGQFLFIFRFLGSTPDTTYAIHSF